MLLTLVLTVSEILMVTSNSPITDSSYTKAVEQLKYCTPWGKVEIVIKNKDGSYSDVDKIPYDLMCTLSPDDCEMKDGQLVVSSPAHQNLMLEDVGLYGVNSNTKPTFAKLLPFRTKQNHSDPNEMHVKHGCHGTVNPDKLPEEPWIALIQRGECYFSEKLKNAVDTHGAMGFIVYNDESSPEVIMNLSRSNLTTIMIDHSVGEHIEFLDMLLNFATRLDLNGTLPYTNEIYANITFNRMEFLWNHTECELPQMTVYSTVGSTVGSNVSQTTQSLQLDNGLPSGQSHALRRIHKTMQAVSIAALLLAFFCIFILRKYRLFHERIICYILLAGFLATVTIISLDGRPEVEGTVSCTVQGYFVQFFALAELLWLCNLTVFVYHHMAKSEDTSHCERLYTAVGWFVPLLVAFFPLITDDYGLVNALYCWIPPSPTGVVYGNLIYWGPVAIGLTATLVTSIHLFWKARKAVKRYEGPQDPFTMEHKCQVKNYLIPLATYAGAFLVLNIILFSNGVLNASKVTNFGLLVFHEIAMSSYGLIWATLFFLTNGRSEFTKAKFLDGYVYYMKRIRGGMAGECEVDDTPLVNQSLERSNSGLQSTETLNNTGRGNGSLEIF